MSYRKLWKLIRFLLTFIALYGIWLIFTADFSIFSLTAGFLGTLLMASLTYSVFLEEHEVSWRSFLPNPWALGRFLMELVILIYKSSFLLLLAIISGKISPRIVHFKTRIRSDLGRMVLSNAITLTPGTVTLDLNDDHLTVYWLFSTTSHSRAAGEYIKGTMENRLQEVWS